MQSGAGAVAVAGVGWGEAVGTSVVRGRSNGGGWEWGVYTSEALGRWGSGTTGAWDSRGLEHQGLEQRGQEQRGARTSRVRAHVGAGTWLFLCSQKLFPLLLHGLLSPRASLLKAQPQAVPPLSSH